MCVDSKKELNTLDMSFWDERDASVPKQTSDKKKQSKKVSLSIVLTAQ